MFDDFEWSPENVIGLFALVVWLLTVDWSVAEDKVKAGFKHAGCGIARVVTINQWQCAEKKETRDGK